jgi:hypothetical protein
MPRFYFNSTDGGRYCDPEGVQLADEAAARREAIRYLAELLVDGEVALSGNGLRVDVTGEDGEPLFVVETVIRSHRTA